MTRDIGYHPDRVPMYSSTPYNREPCHPLNTQDELTVILSQLVSLLSKRSHLPPMEPEIFTGDILTFPAWLRSFEFLIEAHTSSEEEKLFYMGKYTGGEAKNMFRGFLTLSGPGIFTKAKMVLKQRYGERYHIAAAFKKELSGWPVIKPGDGPALRHFSDFLNQCNSAMRTTKYLECLNHADENQKLSQKLPRNLQDRWNRTVDRWLYGSDAERETYGETFEGSFPPFAEFCKFISNEARIACGPGLTGISESTSKSSDKYREKTSFATSLAVETEGPQSEKEKKKPEADRSLQRPPYCNICADDHFGANCKTFLGMTVEERKETALKKGVCFKCLRKGHLVKDCRRTDPSLLFANLPQDERSISDKETSSVASTALHIEVGTEIEHHSPIVPVKIHHKDNPGKIIKTYAVLDNQSNGCFISNSLANQLCTERQPANLKLTTMSNQDIIESDVVHGLVIRGENEFTELMLPATYKRNSIPIDKALIPKPETVERWPHLQKISQKLNPYEPEVGIELLIGVNCSAALLPRQVIAAGDDDPFAVRTDLGWGITGIMANSKKENSQNHSQERLHQHMRDQ